MNQKGFTIFEVFVVIIIMGIISAISIPSMMTLQSNTRKDAVLSMAISVEKAARNHCRQDNYANCPVGTVLTHETLSGLIINFDPSYTASVTVGPGINNMFVHLYKEGAYSFPYSETGNMMHSTVHGVSFIGATASTSHRDRVNIPSGSEIDAPPWEPNTFQTGDYFTYDGKLWLVRHEGHNNEPPSEANLVPDGPYQEITIYYRDYNTYLTGDIVTHNDNEYVALHMGMSGIEPGTAFGWQEITTEWRAFNTYFTGDVVTHNGVQYQANHDGMSGIEPGTAFGWQELTDEWRFYNTYQTGDEVTHTVNGVTKNYIALYFSEGEEPGQFASWMEVVEGDEVPTWNASQPYQSGSYVLHLGALFQAEYYTLGDEPGTHVVWQELTTEWRFYNIYNGGDIVDYNNDTYRARWYTQGENPSTSNVWELLN